MKYTKTFLIKSLIATLVTSLTMAGLAHETTHRSGDGYRPISILDSSEAQWGRRSINDSIYRGYTVNAVYLERGRQKLPGSFQLYKPSRFGIDSIVRAAPKQNPSATILQTKTQSPTTIKVNGEEQRIEN